MFKCNAGVKKPGLNRVELFRVSAAEILQISQNGSSLVADWDSIKWKDSIKVGIAIASPVASMLGINPERIIYQEIQEITGESCRPSVAFVAELQQGQFEGNKQRINDVVSGFIGYVFKENGRNLDLYESNLVDDDFAEMILGHATNFLQENGGGKISTPILVSSSSFNKVCSGSFSPKPVLPHGKRVDRIIVGKVISMFCEKTEFLIRDKSSQTFTFAYNKNIFFQEVRNMLGEPIHGTFNVHESHDPQGRMFLVLDRISEKNEETGPLL